MSALARGLRWFSHRHDDLPAFHAAYLVLAILSAALLNLGVFAVLIVAHMTLDVYKYRDLHRCSWARTWNGVVRESLPDLTLLATGLVFSVYLHHSMGLAGVSGILRSELTILRLLGTLLPKLAILHDTAKIAVHLHAYLYTPHPNLGKPWSAFERSCIILLGTAAAMLLAAASIMRADFAEVGGILAAELVPGMH